MTAFLVIPGTDASAQDYEEIYLRREVVKPPMLPADRKGVRVAEALAEAFGYGECMLRGRLLISNNFYGSQWITVHLIPENLVAQLGVTDPMQHVHGMSRFRSIDEKRCIKVLEVWFEDFGEHRPKRTIDGPWLDDLMEIAKNEPALRQQWEQKLLSNYP